MPARRGAREILALVFLVVGFPPVLGWLFLLAPLVVAVYLYQEAGRQADVA